MIVLRVLRRGRRRRPLVTVYGRAGCHLCEEAERVVRQLVRHRADVRVVDIDADPALTQRYTVRVPVVTIEDREVAEFEVNAGAFAAALRQARRNRR